MPIEQFYFPSKVVNYVNFPELRSQKDNIQTLLTYSLRAQVALAEYNEAQYNRVDLNLEELQTHVNLCREVSGVLGSASNVCYDVLLEIRAVQEQLHNLIYIKRSTGSRIIGLPTNTVEEEGAF